MPISVYYCTVCQMPPEYCEYKGTISQCRKALLEDNPELAELYSQVEAPTQPVKQSKAKKQVIQKVVISIIERTKRKRVTVVTGLDTFNLKKAAKLFSGKFACGAAVSKEQTGEEIQIQGDCAAELPNLIAGNFDIPLESIEIAEPKKKKQQP